MISDEYSVILQSNTKRRELKKVISSKHQDMKNRIVVAALAAAFLCLGTASFAQTPKNVKYTFTEASDLTLIGKLFPDTPNPYHRVDTVKYKGFTKSENLQVRQSS